MYTLSFEEYGLSPEIMNGLADIRIEQPTPLQTEVLPVALQGKHLLVKIEAEDEGTFLIPALQKIAENGEVTGTQVLILTPSIERATKIDELVWAMGYHAQISSALLAMKGNKTEQEQAVLDGAPVIVANPGRLIEILEKNNFQLSNLKLIVIDEAHNMENFSLVSRVKEILRFVGGDPQTLILSENHNKATEQLAKATLKNPAVIGFELANGETASKEEKTDQEPVQVDLQEAEEKLKKASIKVVLNPEVNGTSPTEESASETESDLDSIQESKKSIEKNETEAEEKNVTVEIDLKKAEEKLKKSSIDIVLKKDIIETEEEPASATKISDAVGTIPEDLEQGFINVPSRMKISTLMAHLEGSNAKKVMIFAASKRTTDRLFHIIKKKKWGVVSVSPSTDEETYNERFSKFTSGEMRVCLIGGIPANKVEIEEVDEVINYDVPNEVEEYRYRAELVSNGKATRIISLVSKMDQEDMDRISSEAGFTPTELPLPGVIADKKKNSKNENPKSKPKAKTKKNPQSRNRNNSNRSKNNRNGSGSKRNTKQGTKKKKELALPRPTYDGLSGGRDGNAKSNGVFGWVKKLFD